MVKLGDFKRSNKGMLFDNFATSDILNGFIDSILRAIEDKLNPTFDLANIVIIGIKEGGVPLANLIKEDIKDRFRVDCEIGYIDMTLYRDDPFRIKKSVKSTELPFDIEGKDIILVDDVINSGRTVRATIDEIFDFGRPNSIKLAVFIDKGGRELPICADFVGKKIRAGKNNNIHVDILSKEKCVDKVIKK